MDDADKIWMIKTLGRLALNIGDQTPPAISDISEAAVVLTEWEERFPDESVRHSIGDVRHFLLTSATTGVETRQQPGAAYDPMRLERIHRFAVTIAHWREQYTLRRLKDALHAMGLRHTVFLDGVLTAAAHGRLITVERDGEYWTRIAHIRSGLRQGQPSPQATGS